MKAKSLNDKMEEAFINLMDNYGTLVMAVIVTTLVTCGCLFGVMVMLGKVQ